MAGARRLDSNVLPESPAKRQRTDRGASTSHARAKVVGSSHHEFSDDDMDDLVDMVPFSSPVAARQQDDRKTPEGTQPTQVLSDSQRKPSIVQVIASSPLKQYEQASPQQRPRASPIRTSLASAMAPAGTSFRLPHGVQRAGPKPAPIEISDDDVPKYKGGSSDDDLGSKRADITPSIFARGQGSPMLNRNMPERVEDSPAGGMNRFRLITTNAMYKAGERNKSGSGFTGSVYDSRSRDKDNTSSKFFGAPSGRTPPGARQNGPSRAMPVNDIPIDSIRDFQVRRNIERLRHIHPALTVLQSQQLLVETRNNYEEATRLATERSEAMSRKEVTLPLDEDDSTPQKFATSKITTTKRQVAAPSRTIHDKWSSTQHHAQPQAQSSSPVIEEPLRPRRRLVQGRKLPSSPVPEASPKKTIVSDYGSDSDAASEVSEDLDPNLDTKILRFFNECSVRDLIDISNTTEEIAKTILSLRPFPSLDDIRDITSESSSITKTGKKRVTKRAIGDKLVDVCIEMWTGYEAVDALVSECEALGKPIADEMKRWGFDAFGAARNGELDMVSLDKVDDTRTDLPDSVRDSGVGTPSSSAVTSGDEEHDGGIKSASKGRTTKHKVDTFIQQPSIMSPDIVMKDYQIVGLNWLNLLYNQRLSCILADDMGLGKTCQVISFLAHLLATGVKGPHLVVVPGSTLENWLSEFEKFCPTLSVEPYYGLQSERAEIRTQITANISTINVIVTTYDMAVNIIDGKFLRSLKPKVCVYDEGHNLKDGKSKRYHALMRIPAQFRLLLTGTPLQNNLQELASLLAFILPKVFSDRKDDLEYIFKHKARTTDDDHGALLSAQRIARAKSMLTPFVLRRKKHQVLKHLPAKTCRVEYCEMTEAQDSVYAEELTQLKNARLAKEQGKKTERDYNNSMMALRKAAIHPLLFRRLYDDLTLSKMSQACHMEDKWKNSGADRVFEEMVFSSDFELHKLCLDSPTTMDEFSLKGDEWMDSGKVEKVGELLRKFKQNGDRTLLFSQFTMVLDILEEVMGTLGMVYFRLDGQTPMQERQDMINEFNTEGDIDVFLLSTKAGGSGINLIGANKVIIFDSSFNPQEDIQAENRAHRVGQTREVEVIRLVTRGTIEEQIHALGETKLALDDRVAGSSAEAQEEKAARLRGEKMVEDMMMAQM